MIDMKKIFLIVALFAFVSSEKLSAQQQRIETGPLVDRIRETVYTLNGYIADMVCECTNSDPAACNRNRNRCKDAALTLFVGGGDSYDVGGVRHDPVKMETTSIAANGTKSISSKPMRVYFQRLIGLVSGDNPRYTKVTITSSELGEIRVSSLSQIDDNLYECTATFGQWFYGERGEIVVYKDYTEKSVKCYVKIIETNTGNEFETLLGDTKCGESHRL
jgi:hypothetical protein